MNRRSFLAKTAGGIFLAGAPGIITSTGIFLPPVSALVIKIDAEELALEMLSAAFTGDDERIARLTAKFDGMKRLADEGSKFELVHKSGRSERISIRT